MNALNSTKSLTNIKKSSYGIIFPTASSSNPIALTGGQALGSCMQDNYVIVVYYLSGRIYYSNNYGLTFSLASGAPSGTWFSSAISGQNAIACGDGLLYLSNITSSDVVDK